MKLPPKAFGVLQHLAEHPGQLVSKEELFRVAWPETVVTDSALTVCIKELRKALRDNAKSPRYIEAVHGRGYRFIGTVHSSASQVYTYATLSLSLVGRAEELAKLHEWFELARNGQRQIVFVSGEAGIGKTSLVETFLADIQTQDTLWIGQGQCIEQYGTRDAYLPVFQALGRLCRGNQGKHFIDLLESHAPTWLIQMPALVSSSRFDALQTHGLGATTGWMLRELAEALESITVEQPLVLVLEDLHWSEAATLEFLPVLARRQESARLLVIGTYRPAEVLVQEHPLRGVK